MESEGDEENHGPDNIIIAAEYEDYEGLTDTQQTINNSNSLNVSTKGKYYKQTYRTAWEHMPDFKGWLRGVAGEPTRAYCIYCQKTLHAHRLSLLKHTCTIRHQKAAQLHNSRKGNKMSSMDHLQNFTLEGHTSTQEEDEQEHEIDVSEAMVQYATSTMDDEQEPEDVEEEEEGIPIENVIQFQKKFCPQIITPLGTKPPISTHVFDTAKGTPVSDLQVSLYKLIAGRWTYVNEGTTNLEGRFSNFLEQNNFTPGRYKLHFDVDRYFEQKKQESPYPFIEIVFDCRTLGEHFHIPILLSPFGYTTYNGS